MARLYGLVAVAVLPAIVIQAVNELSLRRDREAQVHEEAQRLAEFAASEINGLIDGAQTLLLALARAPAIRRGDAAACGRLLADVGRDLERYVGLGAVDGSGTWICAQGGDLAGSTIDSADRDWLATGLSRNGLHVGEYLVSPRLGTEVLPVTLPFTDASGRVAGLVSLGINLEWLNRHLAGRSMPTGASFGVADRNGTLIARLPDREQVGQAIRPEFRWMLTAVEPGTLAGTGTDGTQRILGYVPPAAMTDRALLVSVGLSPQVAMAAVEAATRRGILLIVLGVALALIAAHLAGRAFIVQPVQALLQAAERWRGGDFKARVGLGRRSGEFGRLATAFDGMAADFEAHEFEIGRTLRALQVSEERFRAAQEVAPDAFLILRAVRDEAGRAIDLEGVYANPRATGLLGAAPGGNQGARLQELLPGGFPCDLRERFLRVLETGAPDDVELPFDRDERRRWFRVVTVRLEDGLAVRFGDITARKQAEAALRDSEERFRLFAENSRDVIWIYDGRSRRLEFVSQSFANIWGRDPQELLSGAVTFEATVHPDDRAALATALPRALAGQQVTTNYRVLRPDGSVRWVRDSGFPIRDASGAVIRAGGICRDITAWKVVEEEREGVLRDREVMLREINHRVKNNLQVIISLLRLQASRSPTPEVRDAFEEACGRVSTITELHVALFDGAQIGSLDFGPYLHDLCARLEAATRGTHPPSDIRIEVDAESGPVDLDRAVPLGLIVNELVSNAIRHGFPDGRRGTVRVGFRRIDGHYRLAVRDDGAGVAGGPAALHEGLGMQLVGGFVRRIRGRLSIQGEAGFEAVVEFPVEREHAPGPPPKATETAAAREA